ncbi:hypothetical protein BLNAU_19663 [Blattamonas nauphoetae]|uniref:SH3 domain-containing protein n=1 Tax=Blattamonas nauphoetae TaxID=2049346 RepID=A0ABQ9X0V4_9EUKA|nr:hypothetical protein BLNAU_19663 [Blattamonas nauphoetae]
MQTPALEKATLWMVLTDGSSPDPEALNRFFSQFGTVFYSIPIVTQFPGMPHRHKIGVLTKTTEDIIVSTFHLQNASFPSSRLIALDSNPIVNQLFIASLPSSLSKNKLHEIISPHSQCAIHIRKDLENPNTSVAFLIFPTPTEAVHAFMDRFRWTFNGTPLEVTFTTESPLSPRFMTIDPPKPKKATNAPHIPTKASIKFENINKHTTLSQVFEYFRTLLGKNITFQIPENETVMASGSVQVERVEPLKFAYIHSPFTIDFQKPAAEAFNTIFDKPTQSVSQTLKKPVLHPYTPEQSDHNYIAAEVGDIIMVEKETENGWTSGTNERTKEAGWIPTSYLGPPIAALIRPSIPPNARQPNEKLVLLEAQVPQHAQLQSPNLIPFLQKFGEIISFNPISQSPYATHESYHIVLLTRVPFPTINQSISKDPTTNEVKLSLAPIQLDAKKLEIRTLPMGCSEAHLRTLISPHTSCTVVITPSTSPSIQSSSASLVYPSEEAGIAAFRASQNWWFEGQAIKPSFASLSSQLRDASKQTQTPQNGVGEKKINRFLELSNLPKKVTKDIVKSHLPGIEVGTITFINQDVAPGTATVHMHLLTERDYNTVLGWNEKLIIAGRKIKIAAVKPKGEKQRNSSPPSRFVSGPIAAKPLPPPRPQLQPFRVNYTFDPTGYHGGAKVQKGEEVLVSGEREDGWSMVCWPDGRERGIVPTSFIERLNKPLTPSHDTLLQPPHNTSLLTPNTLLPTPDSNALLQPPHNTSFIPPNTLLPTPTQQPALNYHQHQVSPNPTPLTTPAQQPVPSYHQHQVPSVTNSSTQQPAYSPQFVDTPKWQMGQTLRAIEDYSAPPEQPSCLSLRTGQVVTLLEFTEPWCRVRDSVTNIEGFVPTRSLDSSVLPTTHSSYQQPQTWPPHQPIPHQPQLASPVPMQSTQMLPVGQVMLSNGKDDTRASPATQHSPPAQVSSPPALFHPPQPIIGPNQNAASNATPLTTPAQPVQQFEMTPSPAVDVAAAPPPTKEEAKPICSLTGKAIVKRAHMRNEPDVFYEFEALAEFVRDNMMSPQSFESASLTDIVKDD